MFQFILSWLAFRYISLEISPVVTDTIDSIAGTVPGEAGLLKLVGLVVYLLIMGAPVITAFMIGRKIDSWGLFAAINATVWEGLVSDREMGAKEPTPNYSEYTFQLEQLRKEWNHLGTPEVMRVQQRDELARRCNIRGNG